MAARKKAVLTLEEEQITLTFEVLTVTPADAERYLANMVANRKPGRRHVEQLARAMSEGRWRINGETIAFTPEGKLLEGRQRMLACVESGTSFRTIVVHGVPDTVMSTINTGRSRSLADVLTIMEEPSAPLLAAGIKLCWKLQHGCILGGAAPSNDEALEWLRLNPRIRGWIGQARQLNLRPLQLPSSASLAFLYLASRVAPTDVEEFFELLHGGEGLTKDGKHAAILRLRKWLGLDHARFESGAAPYFLATLLRIWHHWHTQTDLRRVPWHRDEVYPELFVPETAGRAFPEQEAGPKPRAATARRRVRGATEAN